MRRFVAGVLVAAGSIAVLTGAMLPLRPHLSTATTALVLVVPVVAGVAVGGLWAGAVAVGVGFLAYDLVFIPPYGTLSVGSGQNWVALGVYAAVMLVVAAVVASQQRARREAARREADTRRLYLLSDLLIGDTHETDLLPLIVSTIHQAFHPKWVALLLPRPGGLDVVATAGEPLSAAERAAIAPAAGRPEPAGGGRAGDTVRLVLTARGQPVGLVAMDGRAADGHDRELLRTYANQAALALERSQLREQAVRTQVLEQADRWRDALMGAVSHDLRTPLAAVKASATTLQHSWFDLGEDERQELLALIESQSDALDRLVSNLLDMTRIRSGSLVLHREATPVPDLVTGAVRALGTPPVAAHLPGDLPPVDVDRILMVQVLANLLENAIRHSPDRGTVELSAREAGDDRIELSVRDHGPGVPPDERQRVFQMFNRIGGGGRAGLGLAIAKAFVEAHDQEIRVEDAPGGGARFVVALPLAASGAAAGAASGAAAGAGSGTGAGAGVD